MIDALAALLVLAAPPDRIAGVVVDPQGLAAPNVRVELSCTGHLTESTSTDTQGRFAFGAVSLDGCALDVEQAGFETVHRVVSRARTEIVVRLKIAAVRQSVEVKAPPAFSLLSPNLEDDDFFRFAGNTRDLIEHARLLAGATAGPAVVYVDGLPGTTLPPLDRIARISVNADPFSAEYNDGDVAAIHIITKAPARTVRFDGGSDAIAFGGRDILSPRVRSDASSGRIGVSAPVGRLPLTFSTNVSAGRTTTALPLRMTVPNSASNGVEDPLGSSRNADVSLDLHYAAPGGAHTSVAMHDRRFTNSNVGVGGLVAEESGTAASLHAGDARVTFIRAGDRVSYEAGALVTTSDSTSRATATTVGVSVPGYFVTGGAAVSASDAQHGQWMLRQVVRSTGTRPWSVGVQAARSSHDVDERPNAAGLMVFDTIDAFSAAGAGAATGTLFLTRASAPIAYASMSISPFAQKVLVRRAALEIASGVRVDYQQMFGTVVLPRLSTAAIWRGFTIRMGAGLFSRSVPDAVPLSVLAADGLHRQQFAATGVSLTGVDAGLSPLSRTIRLRLADGVTRPREVMARTSVERRFGRVTPAVEYTWSRASDQLGADRRWTGDAWLDTLSSDRSAERHRVHALGRLAWARQQIALHYEWVHARDNADGPWSHPEVPGELGAEWARSAGVSPHHVTVATSFMLPGALSLSINDAWLSGSPYNVTTGRDVVGDLLYTDRGGRPRNSGTGTASNVLSAYGYRRIPVPAARGLQIGVGVQGTNLLNNRNYTNWGAVAGAPSFRLPLGAQEGRAVRIFLNVS